METVLQARGDWGEETAARYLMKQEKMVLLAHQWRHEHGELDLIMRQDRVLVFVEVRVRTNEPNPLATYQSVGRAKWATLRKTAVAYLRQCQWRPAAVRFDLVGIRRHGNGALQDIQHWKNLGVFGRNFRF